MWESGGSPTRPCRNVAIRHIYSRTATPKSAAQQRLADRCFVFLEKLLAGDLLLLDFGQFKHEVDDLFLINGRADARQRLRILAVIFPHPLLLTRKLPRLLSHRAADLLVAHR